MNQREKKDKYLIIYKLSTEVFEILIMNDADRKITSQNFTK